MRLRLSPSLEAPGQARRGLAPFAARIDERSFLDLKTVVSELVTIGVAHGASRPIDMQVVVVEGAVEGTLYDEGPGARAIVRARERHDSSLVLRVIDSLVDEWGTNPGQNRIWFRMLLPAQAPAL